MSSVFTILVADESESRRTLFRKVVQVAVPPILGTLLGGREVYVVETADSESALAVAAAVPVALVVLDIDLPGLGGIGTLAELRSRGIPSGSRILVAADTDREGVEAEIRAAGAHGVLRKPASLESVRASLYAAYPEEVRS